MQCCRACDRLVLRRAVLAKVIVRVSVGCASYQRLERRRGQKKTIIFIQYVCGISINKPTYCRMRLRTCSCCALIPWIYRSSYCTLPWIHALEIDARWKQRLEVSPVFVPSNAASLAFGLVACKHDSVSIKTLGWIRRDCASKNSREAQNSHEHLPAAWHAARVSWWTDGFQSKISHCSEVAGIWILTRDDWLFICWRV